MPKDTTPSYQNQLNYIKSLWSEVKENYSTGKNISSVKDELNFNKIDDLIEFNGEELYSIKFFYHKLLNSNLSGNSISHINFITLIFTTITAILKERNIKNYIPDREIIIKIFFKKINFFKKGSVSPISVYIDNEYQKWIENVLPNIIWQKELNKIHSYLKKPNTIYQKEQQKVAELQKQIDEKLTQQQNKIDELKEMLEKQHKELNFVNLSDAFTKIKKEKKETKNAIRVWLVVFFLLLCIIPICLICTEIEEFRWFKVIPFITLEIICLYVFRLFYQQFLSVKSELLQLDLRVNLCAFIEGYMEFKGKHKDDTVDLFEKLIFSNIISSEKKVPATIDGIDSLTKVVCSVQGKQ